ncbi:hypothetical protein Hanom_Chr07g00681021 [Helianthus anomalus]
MAQNKIVESATRLARILPCYSYLISNGLNKNLLHLVNVMLCFVRLFLRISLQSLKRSVRVATRMKWPGQYFWLQTCLGFIWKTCTFFERFTFVFYSENMYFPKHVFSYISNSFCMVNFN